MDTGIRRDIQLQRIEATRETDPLRFLDGFFCIIRLPRGDNDRVIGRTLSEALHDAEADSAVAAGDEDDFGRHGGAMGVS